MIKEDVRETLWKIDGVLGLIDEETIGGRVISVEMKREVDRLYERLCKKMIRIERIK